MSYNSRFFRTSFDLLIRFEAHRGSCKQSTAFSLFCHSLLWREFAERFEESISDNDLVSWATRLMGRPDLLYAWNQKLELLDSQLVHSADDTAIRNNVVAAIRECGLPHSRIVSSRMRDELELVPFETPHFLRFTRTLLLFSTRIKDPEPNADLDTFVSTDQNLPSELPAWVGECKVLERFRRITRTSVFSYNGVQPSSGAVADCSGLRGKPMSKLATSCIANRQAYKDLSKLGLLPPTVLYYPRRRKLGQTTSKLFFVPKNYKKQRSICFEPAMQAWAQRAIEKTMVHDVLKATLGKTDPHSCERNRLLVQSRSMATIDLSNASDSVSSAFLQLLGPVYSRALRSTRSTHCLLPTGDQLLLKKAASMGNGWTFPLECLIFSAIAEEACDREGLAPIYSVFGDDIIVPIGAYDKCRELLVECGFQPNETKSFGGSSNFRESCGYDILWYSNTKVYVSPTRISRGCPDYVIDDIRKGDIPYLIPLANSSYGTRLGLFLTQLLVRAGANVYCDFIERINERSHKIEFPYLFHPNGRLPLDNYSTGFDKELPPVYSISDADAYPLALQMDYRYSIDYPEGRPSYPELRRVRH